MEVVKEKKKLAKMEGGRRVEKLNDVERRLLSRRLNQINTYSTRAAAKVDKDMKEIKEQIWNKKGVKVFNSDRETSEADQGSSQVSSVASSPEQSKHPLTLEVNNSSISDEASTKVFKFSKTRKSNQTCKYLRPHSCYGVFPCESPSTYNNIGFNIRPGDGSYNQFSTSVRFSGLKGREDFLTDLESKSVRRSLQTSMDQTTNKISALKTIIKQMKAKSEMDKPKDWCINYGKQSSKRNLLRVAPASSSHRDRL